MPRCRYNEFLPHDCAFSNQSTTSIADNGFCGCAGLLYNRYRKSGLYLLYQLETTVLFFIALYQIFSAMGNMTQARINFSL